MTYYVGQIDSKQILGDNNPRYFLALRRNDAGDLFFARLDQIKDQETIVVNIPGHAEENFQDFEYGIDYFDGRAEEDHSRSHPNLYFDQYRWDERNCFYYIDDNGNLVAKINQGHTYPPGSQV